MNYETTNNMYFIFHKWFTNGVKIMIRKQWGDKNSDKNDESISFFDTTLLEC